MKKIYAQNYDFYKNWSAYNEKKAQIRDRSNIVVGRQSKNNYYITFEKKQTKQILLNQIDKLIKYG